MTRWLVTFGGTGYETFTERLMGTYAQAGVEIVRVYDDVWLDAQPFRKEHAWLWETEERRGYGWHAWKPLITLDTMALAQPGDVVLYLDGDTWTTGKSLIPYYEQAERDGIVLFDYVGHEPQSNWCTRNCFVKMGCDEPKYWTAMHGCARFGFFKCGDRMAHEFLKDWLRYCCDPDCNARHPRPALGGPNLPGFKEHRTDQAIYTNLAHMWGIPLMPEASEPGEGYFIQGGSERNDDGKGSRFCNVR
jgi:hypothetical protein